MLTPLITFGQVLDAPGGRAVLERHLPDAVDAPAARGSPSPVCVGAFLRVTPGLRDDPRAREQFWAEVDEVMAPVLFPAHAERLAGRPDRDPRQAQRAASAPWESGRRADPLGAAGDRAAGAGRGQPVRRRRAVGRVPVRRPDLDGRRVLRRRRASTGCARWPRRRAPGSSSPPRPPRRSTGSEARSPSGRRRRAPTAPSAWTASTSRTRTARGTGRGAPPRTPGTTRTSPCSRSHPGHAGRLTVHQAADVPVPQALRVQHR